MTVTAPAGPCLDVPVSAWVTTAQTLRAQGFSFFDWLTAVDQLDQPAPPEGGEGTGPQPGFDIVLHLLDVSTRGALRAQLVRARLPVGQPLPSLTGVFRGAAWAERETHEMFGIEVADFDDGSGHGMRPLLLPNGFEGHPLLKSFVLAARASKPWPGAKEPGEGHDGARSPSRRRVQAPGVPGAEWGPR